MEYLEKLCQEVILISKEAGSYILSEKQNINQNSIEKKGV
jgi:hypothetical protein